MVVRGERRMADEAHKVIQKTRILIKVKTRDKVKLYILEICNEERYIQRSTRILYVNNWSYKVLQGQLQELIKYYKSQKTDKILEQKILCVDILVLLLAKIPQNPEVPRILTIVSCLLVYEDQFFLGWTFRTMDHFRL